MNLPEAFLARMKKQLGAEYDAFVASYDADTSYGLRLNLLKGTVDEIIPVLPFALTNVPWIPEGFHVSSTERPGKHILHEAGAYYIQDPSAMSVITLLDPMPGERILDLCAAPGGKSTGIAARMQGQGLLVSNEIIPGRAKILSQNVERMGITNALVCNESPERIASHFPLFFDRIVVDAPCSGEGMFRKEEALARDWTPEKSEELSRIQKQLCLNAADMLQPGGQMLYSTCTFAPCEDEQIISWLLRERPELSLISMEGYEGFSTGNPEWGDGNPQLKKCVRIFPHKMQGEGHFLALLQKEGTAGPSAGTSKTSRLAADVRKYMEEFFREIGLKTLDGQKFDWNRVEVRADKVYYLPSVSCNFRGLTFIRNGLYLGDLKKNRFEPAQPLALAFRKNEAEAVISLSVDDPRLERYLKGETLTIEPEEAAHSKGWHLLCVEGYPLGFGKLVNGTLKNKYPAGWRV